MMALGIGGLGIFTIYNLIVAMGQRVYGKPGYLLFAIPTNTQTIMASKLFTHFVWMLVTVLVFCLGVFSLFYSFDEVQILGNIISEIVDMDWTVLRVIGLSLALIMYMIYFLAFFMFLFALLNLLYKGPHKVLMGILMYFALNTVLSLFTAIPLELIFFKVAFGTGHPITIDSVWTVFAVYFIVATVLTGATYFIIDKKMELQ